MGLHRGEAERGNGDFHGLTMHYLARVLSAARGGQILCSESVIAGLEKGSASGDLTDLGLYRLRGFTAPVRLFQAGYAEMPASFEPVAALPAFTHRLPVAPTRLLGRDSELHDLARMLLPEAAAERRHGRLVTLLGPGGTGKTRLSLAVAERLLPAYSHAVWFVPLAELRDGTLLAETLREELEISAESDRAPLELLIDLLGGQPSLLVLDNFEQLVPSGVTTVQTLLSRVPDLVCLVSSRVRLDLGAEQEFTLQPLRLPPAEGSVEELLRCASVQLFCERAQAARREFRLGPDEAVAVAQLCRALEGMPLAIELAAARSAVLTPRQMLQRLEQRLNFLTGGRRDAPERHRSLRAAIAWSYELLSAPLRRLFARLSVFRGGWTLEAVEAVATEDGASALDGLEELRACSLITATEVNGAMRYGMLEVLREYAAERLAIEGEREETWQHFHRFYFTLTAPGRAVDQAAHFEMLAAEQDNVRALLGGPGPIAERLRAAVSLYPFWMTRGQVREGRDWLRQLSAEAAGVPDAPLPAAANAEGILAWKAADYDTAAALFTSALQHWEAQGHERNMAGVLNNLALVTKDRGDLTLARTHLERALTIYRRDGPSAELAAVLNNLGECALRLNDLDTAQERLEESLAVERLCGSHAEIANALHNLAELYLERGDSAAARRHLAESLALRTRLGSRDLRVPAFVTLAALAEREGRLAAAVTLCAAASRALDQDEENPNSETCADLARRAAALRARLAPVDFAEAWKRGAFAQLGAVLRDDGAWVNELDPAPVAVADGGV
jgi:predicted ATPase/Tfp pilus assembly protein PilF